MIHVENLAIRQGKFSIAGIQFTIPTGNYGILMGKTGSGKTSILEAIAGLRPIQSGMIRLLDRDVTREHPANRGIGYVPQDGALFPSMTVRQQLGFALEIRHVPMEQIQERVEQLAEWLGLRSILDRYPEKLSGGESQRVALGRALSFRPKILLLDEPLSSLDEATRDQLIELLKDLRQQHASTVLHITHSNYEAEKLGETILRLSNGSIDSVAGKP